MHGNVITTTTALMAKAHSFARFLKVTKYSFLRRLATHLHILPTGTPIPDTLRLHKIRWAYILRSSKALPLNGEFTAYTETNSNCPR